MIGDEWGFRLASIIDGEGSFNIKHNRTDAYACSFALAMRADDEEFVRRLREKAGRIGRTHTVTTQGNPLFTWSVNSRPDCFALALILARYPLLSKKRLDFELWRQALSAWSSHDWGRMAVLRHALNQGRKYEVPPVLVPDFAQLEITGGSS